MADFLEKTRTRWFLKKQLKRNYPPQENGRQDGSTQIVSGYAVKKSPLEGLAKSFDRRNWRVSRTKSR